jgi:hypothetical protein
LKEQALQTTKNSPIVIRLDAHVREISVAEIKQQIYAHLQREGSSPQFGYFPFCVFRHGHRPWTRVGDFRDSVMIGLLPIPPSDEGERAKIKRILAADLERSRRTFSETAHHAAGEMTTINSIVTSMQQKLDSVLSAPLTEGTMRDYARVEIHARIRKMLEDDIVSGQLVISIINGKRIVYLDHLAAWTVARKITIEQDALSGCPPLIAASYQRLRQKWLPPAAAGEETIPQPATTASTGHSPSGHGPTTAPVMKNKLRANLLDGPIKKAIKLANSPDAAAVYLELRELALSGEKPFTGLIEKDALCYTDEKNEPRKLTKNALQKRLKLLA